LIYSLACIGVGVALAPARAIAARLILFMPSFRTAFLGPKSMFNKMAVPTIATIRATTTGTKELPGCIPSSHVDVTGGINITEVI
jgi:hypothetical protein